MKRTVDNLKLLVRAGKGEIPADLVIQHGKRINLPITSIPDYAITDLGPVDYRNLRTYRPVLELMAD